MSVAEINNNLCNRIFKQIQTNTFNALISPLSIYYMLSILYISSNGDTRKELETFLGFNPNDDIGTNIKDLLKLLLRMDTLKNNDPNNIFQFDTMVYVDQTFKPFIKPTCQKLIDRIGLLELVDFKHNSIREVTVINDIINKMTHELIPKALSFSDVDSNTKLLLLNVIYFKNKWLKPFKPISTKTDAFCNSRGQYVPLPLMNQTDTFQYYENEHFKLVSLPYQNKRFAMDLYLPRNLGRQNLDIMLRETENFNWNLVGNDMKYKVNLTIPKFNHRLKLSLKSILQTMQLQKIFHSYQYIHADFSNLVNIPINDDLHPYVNNIIHECVVMVDETGTEAAAVTAVIMLNHVKSDDEEIKVFNANHSFLYKIRDIENDLIVFQGLFDGDNSE
jgi:serine protease inhibitor